MASLVYQVVSARCNGILAAARLPLVGGSKGSRGRGPVSVGGNALFKVAIVFIQAGHPALVCAGSGMIIILGSIWYGWRCEDNTPVALHCYLYHVGR